MPVKRLLVLSSWFPYPPDNGSRLRAFYLLRELAKTYQIRLVAGVQADSPDEVPAPLAALCETVIRVPWVWHEPKGESLSALLSPVPRSIRETPNPPLTAAIAAEIAHRPEVVLVMQMGMDAYLPPLPADLPVVLEEAEISGLERAYRTAESGASRLRHGLTYAKGIRYWATRLRRYNAITAVSEEEALAVRRLWSPKKGPAVVVVPNGVDVQAYSANHSSVATKNRLIYNGALTYGPNRDAMHWFVAKILPRIVKACPETSLWITGRYRPEETVGAFDNERVYLTGFLPDLRPALAESAVCVVPLLAGGGTRLKILEAWAARVPVVSTTIGAAGLGAKNDVHLLLRDDVEGFAEAVATLLRNPASADTLARNARALVEMQFDWASIATGLVDLLERVQTVRAETA